MINFTMPELERATSFLRARQAPTEVESVINHRIIGGKHVVAGVSGGVSVDLRPLVQADAIKTADYGLLKANHAQAVPPRLAARSWWWD